MQTSAFSIDPPRRGKWLHGSATEAHGDAFVWPSGSQPRSAVWAGPAAHSRFGAHAGLPEPSLVRTWAIEAMWLAEDASEQELAPALYKCLQRGRVLGCNTVAAHVLHGDTALAKTLRLNLLTANGETRDGAVHPASAQMLDVAIYEAARRSSARDWDELKKGLPIEVVATIQEFLKRFYAGSWASSIFNETMSREQYVQSLSNMHHYVRQTTSHLGRAVALAPTRELRRHFIDHLNGEINHEISIENDLRHLGVDPDYVLHHRVPDPATKSFMAIQETTIAYYQDPMLLMACPLVAEGITANMPNAFIGRLRALTLAWGVASPQKATSFLTSHTHTDGGDDGHWQTTTEALGEYLVDEALQRRFLCTLRTAAECIERSFNSVIDDIPLFSRARQR